jgi:energy-coupling factor transporter transmembrane protein EcfT
VQLRVPPEFFGSGRGPLVNAAPAVRLLTGFLMLLAVLLVPSLPVVGVAMVALAMVTMLVLTGLPAGHLTRVLALGLLFYAPLVSLLALPTLLPTARALLDAAFAGPEQAREAIAVLRYDPSIHRIGWILLKGVASLTVTLATVATVSAAEIRLAIGSLPLPTSTRLILIQIIQQTGMLLDETARVRNAVSLRSGSRGSRGARGLVLAGALPVAWLTRVAGRADRVAAAMEVRGYTSAPLPSVTRPSAWRGSDVGAIAVGLLLIAGSIMLRAGQ